MLIGTQEAAKLLNITTRRLRTLLIEGRVEGAYKISNVWVIPLRDGRPMIRPGTRGQKARWQKQTRQHRHKDYKVVKVLQKEIKQNSDKKKQNSDKKTILPVISVTAAGKAHHVHEIDIAGLVRLCYSLEPRQDKGGAKVWLETHLPIELFMTDFEQNIRISRGIV